VSCRLALVDVAIPCDFGEHQTASISSSSSSLFVQIKIHDAIKEHIIKPEQYSKVEKPHLLLMLKKKKKNTKFA